MINNGGGDNTDFSFTTKLSIDDPQCLNDWRKAHGYSEESFINRPTLQEIIPALRFALGSCVLVAWNLQHELRIFPELKTMV